MKANYNYDDETEKFGPLESNLDRASDAADSDFEDAGPAMPAGPKVGRSPSQPFPAPGSFPSSPAAGLVDDEEETEVI